MEFTSLQNSLLALIPQLERAGLGQIEGLSQLVSVAMVDVPLDLSGLKAFIAGLSTDRIRQLVDFANRRFGPGSDGNASIVPKSAEYQFGVLYNIWLLREVFATLTLPQLTQLLDLVPPVQGPTQLQHLQDLQQLLLQLEAGQFMQIKADIERISKENPGEEMQALTQLVELGVNHFHLYETLRQMLNLNEEDFLSVQSTYPGWSHLHLGLISKLKSLSIFELRDINKLLNPPTVATNDFDDGMDMEEPSASSLTVGARTTGALALQLTDRPPEKCVYKRNVKPPPSVTVEGDSALFNGTVYVVPILSRCDTAEDLPTMMAGNSPVKVTNTRTLSFSKLKILSTTHQMNETMFALRFELRQYERNGQQFKLLGSVTTDPFTVVSHSTQLKPSHKNLPTVTDVIPFSGPPSGSTRVAILGVNFQDSPTTRVRFDNIDVIPIFHGAKTLLVHTPKHEPGVVQVFVCNEPNAWSLAAGTFTYNEPSSPEGDVASQKLKHAFQSANTPNPNPNDPFGSSSAPLFESLGAPKLNNSQGMDFELTSSSFLPNPNKLDARGFAPIHYMASVGDFDGIKRLSRVPGANPRVCDKMGNTCLHWAVRHGQEGLVQALIQSAPDLVKIANAQGETPLLNAVRNGDDLRSLRIAQMLLRGGAHVDQQDEAGLCALHLAVVDGHDQMVRLLLQAHADPRIATFEDSLTALHFGAIYNRPNAVRLISQTGLPVDLYDDEGETPLFWAYRCAALQCIVALLALGANSAVTNTDAETPSQLDSLNLTPSPETVHEYEATSLVFDSAETFGTESHRGPICGSPAQQTSFFSAGVFVQ